MSTKTTSASKKASDQASAKASKPTAVAARRPEVDSVQSLPAGKVAVVTLRNWPPASGLKALREQLKAATGYEPVILPPGATVRMVPAKDQAKTQ